MLINQIENTNLQTSSLFSYVKILHIFFYISVSPSTVTTTDNNAGLSGVFNPTQKTSCYEDGVDLKVGFVVSLLHEYKFAW